MYVTLCIVHNKRDIPNLATVCRLRTPLIELNT
jgi:hypothetical protein